MKGVERSLELAWLVDVSDVGCPHALATTSRWPLIYDE